METINLEAVYDAVIVKPIEEEEKKHGSIIVPDIEESINKMGEIVAIGDGKYSVTGDFLPTRLKVGDIVVLPTSGFTKLHYQNEEYFIGNENMILAKIKK